jgi:hypothetical protein
MGQEVSGFEDGGLAGAVGAYQPVDSGLGREFESFETAQVRSAQRFDLHRSAPAAHQRRAGSIKVAAA